MKVKLLYTTGNRDIQETIWDKPEPTDNQIEVKSILTGICSSDVAMYNGEFPMLPKEIQGHEGLGMVTKVGSLVKSNSNIAVGDLVATRGEPAFADYYNVNYNEFVKVNEALPKYILEPVACGYNIVHAMNKLGSVAIIGSGFLARVVHHELARKGYSDIYVYGGAYSDYWKKHNVWQNKNKAHHLEMPIGVSGFDFVIDFSDKPEHMQNDYVNENGMYIVAADKKVELDLGKFLWKNITIKCPSPRDPNFYNCMRYAREAVASGSIDVNDMWCNSYHRDDAKTAFENRTNGIDKGRTYLTWQ